ncbi:HAD family hydrolase [Paenibacillus luteus]|uniref:HAD family hydrolase n=1 Tax=Paenibacillus luteus TaxID=2545753 RepID=UPI0011431E0E|nr:HAD-IA family hydrolase [Paenibacillus luteus]
MPDLIIHNRTYKVTGILFDKDGTLLDFIAMWGCWSESVFHSFGEQLRSRGLAFDPEVIPSLWGSRHDEAGYIVDYDRNGPLAMGSMQDLYAVLAWQGYLAGLSWAEAMELVQYARKHADLELARLRPARPLPGTLRFLQSCKENGMKLGVVTADDTEAAIMHLEWLGIKQYFDVIIGTDQVEQGKPFPDMMVLACRLLGLACSDTAIIGDTNGDMRMGQAAGAAVTIGIADAAREGTATAWFPNADEVIEGYGQLSIRRHAHER